MANYWLIKDGDPVDSNRVMATARSIEKARSKAIGLLKESSMSGVIVYRTDSFNHGVVSRLRSGWAFSGYMWTTKDGARYILNENGTLGRRF